MIKSYAVLYILVFFWGFPSALRRRRARAAIFEFLRRRRRGGPVVRILRRRSKSGCHIAKFENSAITRGPSRVALPPTRGHLPGVYPSRPTTPDPARVRLFGTTAQDSGAAGATQRSFEHRYPQTAHTPNPPPRKAVLMADKNLRIEYTGGTSVSIVTMGDHNQRGAGIPAHTAASEPCQLAHLKRVHSGPSSEDVCYTDPPRGPAPHSSSHSPRSRAI